MKCSAVLAVSFVYQYSFRSLYCSEDRLYSQRGTGLFDLLTDTLGVRRALWYGGCWERRWVGYWVFFTKVSRNSFAWSTWFRWPISCCIFMGWQILHSLSLMHLPFWSSSGVCMYLSIWVGYFGNSWHEPNSKDTVTWHIASGQHDQWQEQAAIQYQVALIRCQISFSLAVLTSHNACMLLRGWNSIILFVKWHIHGLP